MFFATDYADEHRLLFFANSEWLNIRVHLCNLWQLLRKN